MLEPCSPLSAVHGYGASTCWCVWGPQATIRHGRPHARRLPRLLQNASNDPLYGHWGYNHTFSGAFAHTGWHCALARLADSYDFFMGNTTNRTALNSSTSYSITPDNSECWLGMAGSAAAWSWQGDTGVE
jgi:hypothetical protein